AGGSGGAGGCSAVFAVQKIAHRSPPLLVHFLLILPVAALGLALRAAVRGVFFFAALRAAIGEARLPRFQLEVFPTNYAGFDRKCHALIIGGPPDLVALEGQV